MNIFFGYFDFPSLHNRVDILDADSRFPCCFRGQNCFWRCQCSEYGYEGLWKNVKCCLDLDCSM